MKIKLLCFYLLLGTSNHSFLEQISLLSVIGIVKQSKLELKSTHERLCYPVIERIYKKMKFGIKFSGIKVDGNLIIDGHHRYIASLLAGISLDRFPSNRTSATTIFDWEKVSFDENDWDTESKISYLNKKDAEFNGLSFEEINEMLKKSA